MLEYGTIDGSLVEAGFIRQGGGGGVAEMLRNGRFEMAVAGRSYIGISSMTYVAAGHTKEKEDDDAMVMVNGDDLLE